MQIAKIDENWYKLQKLHVSISANFLQFHSICTNFTQFWIRFFEKKGVPTSPARRNAIFRNFPQFTSICPIFAISSNFSNFMEFHSIFRLLLFIQFSQLFQFSSTFINFHQFSSTSADQFTPIFANFIQFSQFFKFLQLLQFSQLFQFSLIFPNFPQLSSIFIDFFLKIPQFHTIFFIFLQFSSIFFNFPQFAPIFINFFQFSSIFLNFSSLSNLIQFEFINFIRSRKWKPNFQNFSKQLFNYDIFNSDVRASIPALTFLISRG